MQISPFRRVQRLVLRLNSGGDPLEFDLEASAACEALFFLSQLSEATAAARPAPTEVPSSPGVQLSPRVRAGRELREQLLNIRLSRERKHEEADAALAALAADAPSDANAQRKQGDLARRRLQGLQAEAFSYGSFALTREVIRRFVSSPEVRRLLPEEMQAKQRLAKDAPTQKLLLETARHLIASVSTRSAAAASMAAGAARTSLATPWAPASRRCCRAASSKASTAVPRAASWASRIGRPNWAASSTARRSTWAAGGRSRRKFMMTTHQAALYFILYTVP